MKPIIQLIFDKNNFGLKFIAGAYYINEYTNDNPNQLYFEFDEPY